MGRKEDDTWIITSENNANNMNTICHNALNLDLAYLPIILG